MYFPPPFLSLESKFVLHASEYRLQGFRLWFLLKSKQAKNFTAAPSSGEAFIASVSQHRFSGGKALIIGDRR